MAEIAVGQIFKYDDKFYKTEEKDGCNCAFKTKNMYGTTYCSAKQPLRPCLANYRQDKKNVVYSQIIPHINMPYLDINDMQYKIYNGENNIMNENINLCEILKDTPKGTKFYSPICGEIEFIKIGDSLSSNYPIETANKRSTYSFTKEGYYSIEGTPECLLFPSKDQRDWSKYQKSFVNGDIITSKAGGIALFSHTQTHFECSNVVYYHCVFYPSQKFSLGLNCGIGCVSDCRFATEEERNLLFQKIKEDGYKWNAETKTLEKLIVPKFKVGDKIRHKTTNKDDIYEISKVYDDSYGLDGFTWMIYMNKNF